jgi:salicylate hydroxylase
MRAVVVGGGVAGSASAIALARIGAEVVVYEAYEDPAGPVGSYVSLAVNGLRALQALGCLEQVQQAGFPVARQLMWSGRGKLLADVARGRRPEDAMLSVTLMRADLVTALREEALRSGARIITGQRVTGGTAPPAAAAGRTSRGDHTAGTGPTGWGDHTAEAGPTAWGDLTAGADLVVGADGIWSETRHLLDPAAPRPRYAGLYSVSGTSDGAGLIQGRWRPGFNWIFARRGVFIFLPAPDGSVWWTAQVAAHEPPPDPAAISGADLEVLFRTEEGAAAILAAATRIRAANLGYVLAPVARRHDGRTVLIGDAAYPVGAGQGASMALEDAVALASELDGAAAVAAGLAALDRLRQPRSGKLAKTEAANRDAKTAGPVAARVREIVMPHVFNRFYEKATGWLYDYDPGALPVCQPRA